MIFFLVSLTVKPGQHIHSCLIFLMEAASVLSGLQQTS